MAIATLALLVLAIPDAQGSPLPPPVGDWTIDAGESVECALLRLDVRGSVIVLGDLSLDNCTLVLFSGPSAPESVSVRAGGSLACASTRIMPSQPDRPCLIVADEGSTLTMTGGVLSGLGTSLSDGGPGSGLYIATDAALDGVLVQDCLGGLWAAGGAVALRGCTLVGCGRAAVAADGARLAMDDCELVGCAQGAVARSASLTVSGCSFRGCAQAVLSVNGDLLVEGSAFESFDLSAIEVYVSDARVERCRFSDAWGEGVFSSVSSVSVRGCSFTRCRVDLDCVDSTVVVSGTSHSLTADEALYLRECAFEADNVSLNASAWGVRAFASSGHMRDVSSSGCALPFHIDRCPDVTLERIAIASGPGGPHADPRGILVVGSRVVARDVVAAGVRTAISFDGGSGLVDGLHARDMAQAGIVFNWASGIAVRNATVENATDGFLFVSWCKVTLEDCQALRCRATGFNVSVGGWPSLVRCSASGCPVGVRTYGSYPSLVDCELLMRDATGRDILGSVGLDCMQGAPRVTGGSVVGGETGMSFNGSAALVQNTTFLGTRGTCVLLTCSTRDTIEGCSLLGTNGSTGAVVFDSSPALLGNVLRGMKYGIMAMSNLSRVAIEGNTVEDIVFDGIVVLTGARAALRGNAVARCGGSAVVVALFSGASLDGDALSSTGASLVHVHTGSSLEMRRASLSNASAGVRGYDAVSLQLSLCRFVDLGRGVVAERLTVPNSTAPALDVTVDGCFFNNNSGYGVGVSNGRLRVLRCTFIANGAGACAWNSTVEVLDCAMVVNYVGGLVTENSTVSWTVTSLCRLVWSAIRSPAALVVRGGELDVEDSIVLLGPGGGLWASDGATVRVRHSTWSAAGTPFLASCSTVELDGVWLTNVGNLDGGAGRRAGVVVEGGSLSATDTTVRNARGGLRLDGCNATLIGVVATDSLEWGLLASRSDVTAEGCTFERIGTGADVELEASSLSARDCTLGPAVTGLAVVDGEARLVDCALGGAARASVAVSRGRVALLNTTHEAGLLSVGDGGLIEVWWEVTCTVWWGNAAELPEVEVRVADGQGATVAASRPDATGATPRMMVLAVEHLRDGSDDHGPHTVRADLHGYSASRTVALDRSMTVALRLEDLEAPTIVVVLPGAGEVRSASRTVELVARADDLGSGVASIDVAVDDASPPWVSLGGTVARTLSLVDGRHTVRLTAHDRAGNTASTSVTIWVEARPIRLLVSSPSDGLATRASTVTVRGFVSRADVTVRVGGALAQLNGTSFEHALELAEGENRIAVTAEDAYGHRASENLTVRADRTAPELLVTTRRLIYTTDPSVVVEGTVGEGAVLSLNGMPVLVAAGPFRLRVPVNVGENGLSVRAADDVGNEVVERVVVIRSVAEEPDTGLDWWVAVPFIIAVPLVAVAAWYAVLGRRLGGDGK